MKKTLATLSFLLASATPMMAADDYAQALDGFRAGALASLLTNQDLIDAINAQNAVNGALDEAQVIALDDQWRADTSPANPLVSNVLGNAAAGTLNGWKTNTPAVTEIFVMDNHGLNVSASDITSDYWQGDEDKFQQTYGMGAGAYHYSEVEFDESTQTYQVQVSVAVSDPATGALIGAVTVGINPEKLF